MESFFSPEIQVFYEHTSIPLAVYYVENGRFRTYLVSDGICRMYESTAEEIMSRLNGDHPFVNIVEKDEMLRAVREFSDDDATYNVVFHEYVGKNRKLKTFHAVGSHEFTRDGRRYSIVRYDEISDKSRQCLFRDEKKELADRERLIAEIDDALASSYTSVAYVDVRDKSAYIVRLNKHGISIMEEIAKDPTLRNMIDVYTRSIVYRDDVNGVLNFGDLDYVMERLKESNPLFHTYRTIRDGKIIHFRLKIIPFDNGTKLVYGFEYFEDQIREQLARKNEQEIQTMLLAGLSCEYDSVWLVDSSLHYAKLIRNNLPKSPTVVAASRDSEGNYDNLIGNYIDNYVVAEDRDRMYLETSMENLIRNTKEGEIFHINYARISVDGQRNFFQESIARVTAANGIIHFVCGFRNIDAIIEEEKNRNMLYSMAHIDHMTNLNNRRTFDEYMDNHKGLPIDDDLVFISFDLNDLKETNDTFGHEMGDELIVGAANCMKEVLGGYGMLFRTGGDEFAALINVPAEERAALIKKLHESFDGWRGTTNQNISISIGYVGAKEHEVMTLDDMRREAEKRMYANKADHYMQVGNDRRRTRNNTEG